MEANGVANALYSASEWMQLVMIGGLFGALGQAIRVIPGLKKAADAAAANAKSVMDDFSGSRLLVSLLIGAVAGVLGAISLGVPLDKKIATSTIIALLGVGYSGADFIEAFMARAKPSIGAPGGATASNVAEAAPAKTAATAADQTGGGAAAAAPKAVG
jgi:hypothetical protein